MELHLKIIGLLLMVLAFVHIIFPKYFNWKEDLKPLSIMNRQMLKIHAFFIALTVFLIGLLCFSSPTELINTPLGKKISLGLAVFWSIRLFTQFFGYSSKIWRGKTFETIMHILFSIFWVYLCFVFWSIYLN